MTFAQIIDGPLWYFAATVFILGVIWRLIGMLVIRRNTDLSKPRASAVSGSAYAIVTRFFPKSDMGNRIRVHLVGGYLFHLGLFVLLLFAAPHIDFYRDRVLGFGWSPIPHWAFILVSELAFLGLLLLWLNRVLNPVTRLISTTGDHMGSILTFLVMLTGCLALGRSHESLRLLHFFLVEMLMIYFPFSPLMHTFTFIFSRSALGAHYGRRGVRV